MNLLTQAQNGWNQWYALHTVKNGIPTPHAHFPDSHLPSSGFIAQTYSTHCEWTIPWHSITSGGAYNTFLSGGGGGFTIAGAMAGMSSVLNSLQEPTQVSYSIGRHNAPLSGYCIGDLYKEFSYLRIDANRTSTPGDYILNYNFYNDIFQRSRLHRMYFHHGLVVQSFAELINDGEYKYTLVLDIGDSLPEGVSEAVKERDFSPNFSITITKVEQKDGTDIPSEFTVQVKDVLDNFHIVIEKPPYPIDNGDFYELNNVFSLRDPYLLTGYYVGTENDGFSPEPQNSGFNIHRTSDNRFYDECCFTGYYVFKNIETKEIISVASGSSFFDAKNSKWHWIKNPERYSQSEVYGTEKERFGETKQIAEEDGEEGVSYITNELEKRQEGTPSDLDEWMALENGYVRAEISKGGDSFRNNWHSPILTKEWIQQNGHYFKILSQPDGNVIDISTKDISGKFELDLNEDIKIFNQYGWFIVEHFMGETREGIFGGTARVQENENNKIIISSPGESSGTIASNVPSYIYRAEEMDGVNSFYNRFRLDTASEGGTSKLWTKQDGWTITDEENHTFKIKSIVVVSEDGKKEISEIKASRYAWHAYEFEVEVEGNAEVLNNKKVWTTFGMPYERNIGSVLTPLTSASFAQGVDESRPPMATLCGELSYFSLGVKINIPVNSIVGICGGRWWGNPTQANVMDNDYLPLLVSTRQGTTNVSAFYDDVFQKGWILYKDAFTNRATIRTGSLGFRELPEKMEVSFGRQGETEITSELPLHLNSKYERTKAITIKTDFTDEQFPLTFGIGTSNDYYGFIIGGDGAIDLQPLRSLGYGKGEIDIEAYKFKGFYCSPLFSYYGNNGENNFAKISMGIDTRNDPIYFKNGITNDTFSEESKDLQSVSEIKVEYINNDRTLQHIGYTDIHQLPDGEILLVFSTNVPEFKMEEESDELNNSPNGVDRSVKDQENKKGNEWSHPYGIFVMSTTNGGHNWHCPMIDSKDFGSNDSREKKEKRKERFQWPLMILNNINYHFSLYDRSRNALVTVSTHFDETGKSYLGCFIVPIFHLPYHTELCATMLSNDESEMEAAKFLWRPPAIETKNSSEEMIEKWTIPSNYPTVLADDLENYLKMDSFIRIIGPTDTECKIEDNETLSWGIVSGNISQEGYYRIFYDDVLGIRLLYSDSSGVDWIKSQIVLAKDGYGGFCIDNKLFYISVDGIRAKNIGLDGFGYAYRGISKKDYIKGIEEDSIEEIQQTIDDIPSVLIGSGPIMDQRISGYEDDQGITYIYYYNNNGSLSSIYNKNGKWEFVPNF